MKLYNIVSNSINTYFFLMCKNVFVFFYLILLL